MEAVLPLPPPNVPSSTKLPTNPAFLSNRKHGTYRPTLAALVASNPPSAILTSTRTAFTTYSTNPDTSGNTKALNALTTLKGVGPATASLLLSCYDPTHIPFFSDELYRYLHWEEGSRGKGWDRKIGYTLKEYRALCDRLQILRLRLEHESGEEVKAVDIEKMAYALAKSEQQAEGLGEPKGEGEGDGEDVQPTSSKKRSKDKDAGEVQPPSSKKRSKVEDIKEMQPAPSKKRSKIQDTKEVQPPASKKLKKSSRPLR